MVIDKLEYAPLYYGLGDRFRRALEWLCAVRPDELPTGQRVDIDGDCIYATKFELDTLPREESKLEGHQRYADIQCLIRGGECVGWAPEGTMEPVSAYDEKGDIRFFQGDWDCLALQPGSFYIAWPQDLHAPRVANGLVGPVTRIVVKVKLS